MKMIYDTLASIDEFGAERILLTNPDTEAKFPVCVIQPPLQSPTNHHFAYDLSLTIDVWGESHYQCMSLYDKVKYKLMTLNILQRSTISPSQDEITKRWRYGGYFEVRWNVKQNTLEINI